MACSKSTENDQKKQTILTSFYPVWFMTSQIVDSIDDISVELMINGSGGCPHNLSLTPREMQKLYDADVIVSHGLGIDAFLDHAVEIAKAEIGDVPRIVLSDGISDSIKSVIAGESNWQADHDDHEHEHVQSFDGLNPHCWVSPKRAAEEVRHLTVELASIFPEHTAILLKNGNSTASRLDSLAIKFSDLAESLPNQKIVTVHDAYIWLSHDTGLDIVATLETEGGSEPSPRELNELIETILTEQPIGIFIQQEPAPDLAMMVSERTKTPIFVLDPVSYGTPDPEYYFEVMEKNYLTLKLAAIKGK
ncbi:metal ABC transporter substrate-binding protein [bacterium]|nr:metal ABC transporter substrate-binding protein [bacterium]